MRLLSRGARAILDAYDRGYRALYRLDAPAAQVGPALCVAVRKSRHAIRLADGVAVRRGDPIGVLHLNNRRIVALHDDSLGPRAIGLAFRRRFVASLGALAALAAQGGPLAHVRAFCVTTIFSGLPERLGFDEARDDRLPGARVIAAYQRALLAALHPAGPARLDGAAFTRARRLWISRERLLALYAPAAVSERQS